jgi:hypothetical protein
MYKVIVVMLCSFLVLGCNNQATTSADTTKNDSKPFHPTDSLLIGGNGGFNPSGKDGGADLGDLN